MKRRRWKLPGLIGVLICAVPSFAQPTFRDIDSIELTVLRAETVVIGRVVGFEPLDKSNRGSRSFSLAVTETLKGEKSASLTVALLQSATTVQQLIKRKGRVLVSIPKPNTKFQIIVLDLDDPDLKVVSSELSILKSPDMVINAAKTAIDRDANITNIESYMLTLPAHRAFHGMMGGMLNSWNGSEIKVPVDSRLEQMAVDWIHGDQEADQVLGVRTLKLFKSVSNIALLQSLIRVPDTIEGKTQEPKSSSGRPNLVKQAAYEVLNKEWGMNVQQ